MEMQALFDYLSKRLAFSTALTQKPSLNIIISTADSIILEKNLLKRQFFREIMESAA